MTRPYHGDDGFNDVAERDIDEDEYRSEPNACGGYYCDESIGHVDCQIGKRFTTPSVRNWQSGSGEGI